MAEAPGFDRQILQAIVETRMPYGKYKDTLLCDIPISYLEWMNRKNAFPKGKLGMQLHTVLEIKSNGLSEIIDQLKKL
ncbi:MAG: hypothetical protein RL660_2387 [Bacteroidota bacterium]|jgi:uncharacterized protein (DUF3820 family)